MKLLTLWGAFLHSEAKSRKFWRAYTNPKKTHSWIHEFCLGKKYQIPLSWLYWYPWWYFAVTLSLACYSHWFSYAKSALALSVYFLCISFRNNFGDLFASINSKNWSKWESFFLNFLTSLIWHSFLLEFKQAGFTPPDFKNNIWWFSFAFSAENVLKK